MAIGLLGLSVVVLVVEMLRANVLPVVPLVLLAAGPVGVLALAVGISSTGGDAGDVMAYPMLLTAVGFIWLGAHLVQERAVDGAARGHGPLVTG